MVITDKGAQVKTNKSKCLHNFVCPLSVKHAKQQTWSALRRLYVASRVRQSSAPLDKSWHHRCCKSEILPNITLYNVQCQIILHFSHLFSTICWLIGYIVLYFWTAPFTNRFTRYFLLRRSQNQKKTQFSQFGKKLIGNYSWGHGH